jgi:hypothetical protein
MYSRPLIVQTKERVLDDEDSLLLTERARTALFACSRQTEGREIKSPPPCWRRSADSSRPERETPSSCQDYAVQLLLDQAPPPLSVSLPWREL